MNIQRSLTLAILLGLVCLPGCAESEPSVEQQSESPVTPQASPKQQDSKQASLAEVAQPIDESPEKTEEPATNSPSEPVQDSAYLPPFPNRTDLFAAPQRQGGRRVSAEGDALNAIELVGFVNVNGLRAVLSINGLEMPIGEGDTRDGIEVISIQEKSVVLQRGRQRWQATLQN